MAEVHTATGDENQTLPNRETRRRKRKALPPLPNIDAFPSEGYSRWVDAYPFVRHSREWVRQKEAAGLFPQGIRISWNERLWPNAELKRWIRDPINYRAPAAEAEAA